MLRQLSWPCAVVLCLFPWLVASGYTGGVEEILAAAEQAEQGGQLDAAAELYHRAAAIRPEDFNLQCAVGLHCILLENWAEAEEHLKKTLSLRYDFAPAHLNLGVVDPQNGQKRRQGVPLPKPSASTLSSVWVTITSASLNLTMAGSIPLRRSF
jgi:tetratricopeptide (TPR) repeat protein